MSSEKCFEQGKCGVAEGKYFEGNWVCKYTSLVKKIYLKKFRNF